MKRAKDKFAQNQRLVERLCPTDNTVDRGRFYKAIETVAKHYEENPEGTKLGHIVKLAIDSGVANIDTLIGVASSVYEANGNGKMKKGQWLQVLQGQTSVTPERKAVIIGAIVDHFMKSDDMRSWQQRQAEEKAEAASSANGHDRHVPKESGHAHERFTGHASGQANGSKKGSGKSEPKHVVKTERRILHEGLPVVGVK